MAQVLESIAASEPSVAPQLDSVKQSYERQLWHEMTMTLLNTVDQMSPNNRTQLWEKFIRPVMDRMNSLSVAKLVVLCVPQDNPTVARQFLKEIAEKVKAEEAWSIIKAEEGAYALAEGKSKEVKQILEEVKATIGKREAHDLPAETHAAYYKAQAKYLWKEGLYSDFYNTNLLFLVYSDLNEIPKEQQQRLAYEIGIAALVGEKTFNFGELLNNPVMDSLAAGPHAWLDRLLRAFNTGDLDAFERIIQESGQALEEVDVLKRNSHFLQLKLRLMALLQYLFTLKESSRVVSFEQVAQVTKEDKDNVEKLLLKALALGIIRGSLDQISGTITITWVQARVLGREEAAQLAEKMRAWQARVNQQMAELVQVWNGLEQENEAA